MVFTKRTTGYRQGYKQVVSVEVHGVAQAEKNLRTLEKKIVKSVLRKAGTAGAKPLIKAARLTVPVDSGCLQKSIRQSTRLNTTTGKANTIIRPRGTKSGKARGCDPWYAHIVIGGASAHQIPTRSNAKMPVPSYADHPFSRINHPGHAGNDFMWRAAHIGFRDSVNQYRKRFIGLVEEETRKLPK